MASDTSPADKPSIAPTSIEQRLFVVKIFSTLIWDNAHLPIKSRRVIANLNNFGQYFPFKSDEFCYGGKLAVARYILLKTWWRKLKVRVKLLMKSHKSFKLAVQRRGTGIFGQLSINKAINRSILHNSWLETYGFTNF